VTRSRRPPGKRERAGAPVEDSEAAEPEPQAPRRAVVLADLAIMLGALLVATVTAELAGAENLGTSLSFGQIAFALAAVYVFVRR
jgi:hypothetical protein